MKTFIEFLRTIHHNQNPMLLDDDLPDAFDDWLGQMPQDRMIDYADLYANELLEEYKKSI